MFNWLFPKKYYFLIRYTYGGTEHDIILRAKHDHDAMRKFYKKYNHDEHSIKYVFEKSF